MSPKSNEIDCICSHDGNPAAKLSDFLEIRKPLIWPIDLELSSSSSSMDTSTSMPKDDSISIIDDDSNRTPRSRWNRSFPSDSNESMRPWKDPWLENSDRCKKGQILKTRSPRGTLYLCIAAAISVIFCSLTTLRASSSTARAKGVWRRFLRQDALRIQSEIQASRPGDKFTMRLKGSRLDLIQQSLDIHSRCSSVKEIQVESGLLDNSIPNTMMTYGRGKVAFVGEVSTSGVLLLSEEVILSCEEIEKAFNTWRMDPSRLVGFFVSNSKGARLYAGNSSMESTYGPYFIVSDRAVFVHKLYIDSLPLFLSESCCHSLLSIQISVAYGKSPIIMKGKPRDLLETNVLAHSPRGQQMLGTTKCDVECIPDWILPKGELLPVETSFILA